MYILIGVCVLLIVALIMFLRKVLKNYFELCNIFDELAFIQGDNNTILQQEIKQKFEDTTLIYNVEKGTTDYAIIVDTSKYLKNNLIGLTYLVPAHEYEQLAKDVIKNIKDKVKDKYNEDIEPQWLEDSVHDTMDGVVIPHCDIYQLKNGRWIWRSKLEMDRGI